MAGELCLKYFLIPIWGMHGGLFTTKGKFMVISTGCST